MASKEINQKQLVKIFKDIKKQNSEDNRFCFLLGAGASKSSGIPTGWELATRWYADLKDDLDEEELEEWEHNIEFDENRIGEFYPQLYEKRYCASPKVGYDEFKHIMENKEPSIGYVILSQILAKERHNFVITTNFDYLVEDAVRMYTDTKPFSAGHETLAPFISSQTERPTIIKVHRDLFFNPLNDDNETKCLKEEWKDALKPILRNFNLLVLGYGGNDGSLMDYLQEIDCVERKAIYWCKRKDGSLNEKVLNLLSQKDFIVTINDFDELMYALHGSLDYKTFEKLDAPDEHQFVIDAKKRISDIKSSMKDIIDRMEQSNKGDSSKIETILSGELDYYYNAIREKDVDKKEKMYKEGISKYPESSILFVSYATFLHAIRKDYDKAEEYYKKALEVDPENTYIINDYALFIRDIRKDFDQAEKYYKRAIELAPENANCIGSYADFLHVIRKDYDAAAENYKKSIELDPENANNIGNYAHFLIVVKRNFNDASILIDKAFELNSINSGLLSELWFYRYAHYQEYFIEGEKELEKLVAEDAKSIGWDLQSHVEIAKENNHPKIEKLQYFADKITKEDA